MKAFGYTLDPEVIDEAAIEFFTCGQCWALAEVLERNFGWEPILERDTIDDDWWYHALVMHPDGLLLDIRGFQGLLNVHRTFEEDTWVKLARDCWNGHMNEFSSCFRYYRRRSLEIAEAFLPTLLAEYFEPVV